MYPPIAKIDPAALSTLKVRATMSGLELQGRDAERRAVPAELRAAWFIVQQHR